MRQATSSTLRGIMGRKVFPFYVVCDVSRSMWDLEFLEGRVPSNAFGNEQFKTPFDQIEQSLPGLIETLEDDLSVRDTAYVSVVAFGDRPQVVLPLTALNSDDASAMSIRPITKQFSTDYVAIFKHLNQQMSEDTARLVARGYKLYTPAMYFITDGNPQAKGKPQSVADWLPFRQAIGQSTAFASPSIVAIGMGDVSADTVRLLASTRPPGIACMANGAAPEALLAEIVESIIHSIGSSSGSGYLDFKIPDGMTKLT